MNRRTYSNRFDTNDICLKYLIFYINYKQYIFGIYFLNTKCD